MKFKRGLLFALIVIIFFSCMFVMNKRFDRLSRYEYGTQEERNLINKYMTDEEIEFIIEYSVDPSYFIGYVDCDGFNIFHMESYEVAKQYCWYLSNTNIVQLVEKIYRSVDETKINETLSLLQKYNFEEVIFYLDNGDKYGSSEGLYPTPDDYHIVFEEDTYIGNHTPYDLMESGEYVLKKEAFLHFANALEDVNRDTKSNNYGGIQILDSYLSYEDLENMRRKDHSIIPGHNEHQTALCVDIDISNSVYTDRTKYFDLVDIFESYGFKITNCGLSEYHLRYNPEYIS